MIFFCFHINWYRFIDICLLTSGNQLTVRIRENVLETRLWMSLTFLNIYVVKNMVDKGSTR
jgi:hypothetical protein